MIYAVLEHDTKDQTYDVTFYDDYQEAEFYHYVCTCNKYIESVIYQNAEEKKPIEFYTRLQDSIRFYGDNNGKRRMYNEVLYCDKWTYCEDQ